MIADMRSNVWLQPMIKMASYTKNVILKKILFESRRIFLTDQRLVRWKKLKNRYKGKRCFIIATGPSLTMEDMRKLKKEYTFGMNSLCMMFEELGWETTFYGIQDYNVYERFAADIKRFKTTKVFLGNNIEKMCGEKLPYLPFYIDYLNHRYTYTSLSTKFSWDIYDRVYDGYTITYSLLQIAVYLGFTKIYLLGNDCSYSNDPAKQHFKDFGHYDPTYKTARRRILYAYRYARQALKHSDVRIYNATRGGKLNVFPRVDLDAVLAKR